MEWFIELQGDDFDLERFAKAFAAPPVAIWKEGNHYRLRDESLDDSDDAEYVRTELQQTLLRINALARLEWGDHDDVRPSGVGHPNANGGTDWYESATIVGRARVTGTLTVIGPMARSFPTRPALSQRSCTSPPPIAMSTMRFTSPSAQTRAGASSTRRTRWSALTSERSLIVAGPRK
jgi:hypothetical protein